MDHQLIEEEAHVKEFHLYGSYQLNIENFHRSFMKGISIATRNIIHQNSCIK